MALLARKESVPPDGFQYTQAETKARLTAHTLAKLTEMVRLHRQHHGLKPDDSASIQTEIERQICMAMPPGWCLPEPGESYEPLTDISRTLTLSKIESFSKAAFAFVRSGVQFVSDEEATRRANICRGCKFNFTPHACMCTPLWKLIGALIPAAKKMEGLRVCAICGCALQAKVLMPQQILDQVDGPNNYRWPTYCWNHHG